MINQTTDIEARSKRIARRKQIIEALFHTYAIPFKLVQLGLESKEPLEITLNFAAKNFTGWYAFRLIELLKTLQEAGLVKLSQSRDTTSYEVCVEDETAKSFLDELFR